MSWFIPRLLQQQTIPSRCCHFLDVVATNPKFSLRQSCHLPAGLPGPQEECYPAWVRHFTNIFQKCLKILLKLFRVPKKSVALPGWTKELWNKSNVNFSSLGILWITITICDRIGALLVSAQILHFWLGSTSIVPSLCHISPIMVSETIPSFRKLPSSFESKTYSLTQVDCVNFTDPVLSPSSQGGGLVGDQCVRLVGPKLLSELPPRTNRLWRVREEKVFWEERLLFGKSIASGGWIWQIAIYLSAG